MKLLQYMCLVSGLCLVLGACSNTSLSTIPYSTLPPATDPATTQLSQTPEATPLSLGASMLQKLPKCDGIQVMDEPIIFDWPNIDERLQELSDAQWGYYSCPSPREEVAAFYRERLPKPPTNMIEMNWVERFEGSVGVYYNGSTTVWTYVWVVSQTEDARKSFVIVAQSLEPVQGECRLEKPFLIHLLPKW
jgi:hypothetical protein